MRVHVLNAACLNAIFVMKLNIIDSAAKLFDISNLYIVI